MVEGKPAQRCFDRLAFHSGCSIVRRSRLLRVGAMAVAVGLAGGLLSACGTQTTIKTVTANPGGSSSSGDTLTLSGGSGESMAVTVDQVMDPLPVGPDDQPDSGHRFVGVQITLKNVGSVAYSDSPSNGSTLLSNTNEQAQGQIVSGGPCGNGFASSARIAPGGTQQGCIPFEMVSGQTPASFQFTLNSGFADQTGQWTLSGAAKGSGSSAGNASAAASPPSSAASCGAGVFAGPNTSCPFAKNVKSSYESNHASTQNVYSPVTGQSYTMTCVRNAGLVTCTGGNNASVYFSG